MSYCPNCGHIVEANASECANCSAIFGNGGWSPVAQPIAPPDLPSWRARTSQKMSNFTYWICFTLVAFATIYFDFRSTLLHFGIQVPGNTMLSLIETFGKLTPQMLTQHLPRELVQLIDQAVLLLVARRLWLLTIKRQGVPHSYAGIAKAFGYIGSLSLIFFVLGIFFTIAFKAGSPEFDTNRAKDGVQNSGQARIA